MKPQDTYKEVKVFSFPNMTARVHIPELTDDEKARRMRAIYKAAEKLLKNNT